MDGGGKNIASICRVGRKNTAGFEDCRQQCAHLLRVKRFAERFIDMKKLWEKFRNTFLTKKFILFCVVGVINTFNGVLFSYLYSLMLDANLAFVAGYITSLTVNYLLNSFITFKEPLSVVKFLKFCISYIPNFIIQNLAVLLVYNVLHFDKIVAYILAAVVGIPLTFIILKLFAFRRKDGK
jgi:gtrA family protein